MTPWADELVNVLMRLRSPLGITPFCSECSQLLRCMFSIRCSRGEAEKRQLPHTTRFLKNPLMKSNVFISVWGCGCYSPDNLLGWVALSFERYFFPVQLDACNRVSPGINIGCSVEHCCMSLCLPSGR